MSAPAVPEASKFQPNRPAKPMLARVAESMYWMSRYIERAEHVARLVLVNDNVLTDVGDIDPQLQRKLWQGLLEVLRLEEEPRAAELLAAIDMGTAQRVAAYMTFDPDNPNSLLTCLTKARENARSIREMISSEMWEALNTLYWAIRADDARGRFDEAPQETLRQVMTGSFLFQGLTSHTMAHEQGRLFAELAKFLERADITCRIVDSKFEILRAAEQHLEGPLRNIHWMAVLKSCCSIEAYRRLHPGDVDPVNVALFLILEQHIPRSVSYGVRRAHEAVAAIGAGTGPHTPGAAERVLARLDVQLESSEPGEILAEGVQNYLRGIREKIAQAVLELQKEYFLH